MSGKSVRIKRIMNRSSGSSVMYQMDNPVFAGTVRKSAGIKQSIHRAVENGVNAIVLHKGNITNSIVKDFSRTALLLHLMASTGISPIPYQNACVCSVEEAITYGADGVSIQINMGEESEGDMLKAFGEVGKKCSDWQIPLIARMYTGQKNESNVEAVKLAARVANELGADIVNVNFTGDRDSFSKVVEGCSVPILIAEDTRLGLRKNLFERVRMAIDAGAKGVSITGNAVLSEESGVFYKALSAIVHEYFSVEEALNTFHG